MNKITIISTRAEDILVNQKNAILSKQKGGPLLFIEDAMRKENIPFQSFSGSIIKVKILINEKGEFGKIDQRIKSSPVPLDSLSDYTIVSTVLDEWNLQEIADCKTKLFLDIQGYVRDGKDFGRKKQWNNISNFYHNIYCLKGTSEEVIYLPPHVLENQKKKMLLITNASNDVELWFKGKKTVIPVINIVKNNHTIGAGDTFFGYFVVALYQGADPVQAVKKAIQATSYFLASKA